MNVAETAIDKPPALLTLVICNPIHPIPAVSKIPQLYCLFL